MARIVFFGTPKHVVCVPEELKKAGHEIVAVVPQPPKPVGRKQIITPSPVASWAKVYNIKIFDGNPREIINDLKTLKADIGVLEAYGRILPQELVDHTFTYGIINVHPSLLPKYRGSSPIQAAIFIGDKQTGITVIKLDDQMDHGPILFQKKYPINEDDTLESLQTRLFEESAKILCKVIPDYLEGKIKLVVQKEDDASYTWKTQETKQKAYFDISNAPNLEALDRMARAFYPWPGAWTKWQGKVVKFLPNKMVQIEGKRPVSWKQFKEGYRNFPLELF